MTKIRFRLFYLVIIVLIIVGCAPPMAPRVPTRDILYGNETAEAGFGAYGYVVFTQRPADVQRSRENAVCRGYLRRLEPTSAYPSHDKSKVMPTFWLLKSNAKELINTEDCDALIESYDFASSKDT